MEFLKEQFLKLVKYYRQEVIIVVLGLTVGWLTIRLLRSKDDMAAHLIKDNELSEKAREASNEALLQTYKNQNKVHDTLYIYKQGQ